MVGGLPPVARTIGLGLPARRSPAHAPESASTPVHRPRSAEPVDLDGEQAGWVVDL